MKHAATLAIAGCLSLTAAGEETLHESIRVLEPMLGTWEINATWSHGATLWGRATYERAAHGRFVVGRTWVSDAGGPVYLRYVTTYAAGPDGTITTSTANADGSLSPGSFTLLEDGDLGLRSEWDATGGVITNDFIVEGDDARWIVKHVPSATTDATLMMDGTWRRVSDEILPHAEKREHTMTTNAAPIDHARFVASGMDVDGFVIEQTINAPTDAVYSAFTDRTAFPRAYDPERPDLTGNIELAIGGPYEWLWDGKTGSNGCQVLSYIPNRMVSFSWNAPPSQPESREVRTWVVVEFTSAGDATHVRITHLGFNDKPHMQETKAYFEKAWPYVLDQFAKHLGASPGE